MSDKVQEILKLVGAQQIDVDALAVMFDGASHAERVAATRGFSTKIQSRLYEAAEGRPVTLEDMVPVQEGLREVIHWGTNTLPAFRQFQKRFCRPSEAHARPGYAWGYNHNWYWWATAPGYYVSCQEESGQFLVSYLELPPEKAEAWPPIWSNNMGLGFLVWHGMVDRLWKVSEHVTIGRAFKGGKPMSAWFVLVRED